MGTTQPPWVSMRPSRWPAFSPLDLAPEAWWCVEGNSYADSGATLAVADDPIYQINDLSGNGRHLVQSTLSSRPTYKTGILNGKAVARLDGVDDWMRVAFALSNPLMIYSVGIIFDTNRRPVDGVGVSATFYRLADRWRINNGTTLDSLVSTDSNVHLFSTRFAGDETSRIRVDGVDGTAGNTGHDDPGGVTVGANNTTPIPSAFSQFDVSELLVYSGVHASDQVAAIESYLATRYGITLA